MNSIPVAIAANNGDIGGGEVMLLNIARAVREIGLEPLVLGPAAPAELVDAARDRGFSVQELKAHDRRSYMASLRRWRRAHPRIPLWCNGLVPSFATAGMGPRLVHLHIAPHGAHRIAAEAGRFGARRVLVPSRNMARRIRGSAVLANWTESLAVRDRPRRKNSLRVGFLGRLTRDKGVHILADAIARLRDTGCDATLVLAGENRFGSAEDDTVIGGSLARLGPAVEDLGWTDRRTFFDAVDLAVFPSVWAEPFGLVVAEAMAVGCPFVISDAGALPEVAGVDHPWVARAGDPEHLARVITEAAGTLDDCEPQLQRARRRWEREFSPQAGTARVRALLRTLDTPDTRGEE